MIDYYRLRSDYAMAIQTVTRGGTVNRRQFVRMVGGALVFVPPALAMANWPGLVNASCWTISLAKGVPGRPLLPEPLPLADPPCSMKSFGPGKLLAMRWKFLPL